jgi:hypothetical protein
MPNLLLDLETAISEGTDISAICENIEELSAAAAVREVHTLAKTLRILTSTGDLEDPATFVADIEAAYTRAVRAQNGLASAPISEVPPTPVRPWSRQ